MKIEMVSPTEAAEAEAKINQMDLSEFTPQERQFMLSQATQNFTEWDKRLWDRNGYSIAYNHFMSENARQWGHKPGINSGNGQFEARIPAELFTALSSMTGPYKDDPNWYKDDRKFEAFLKDHPEYDGRPGKNHSRGEKFLPDNPISLV